MNLLIPKPTNPRTLKTLTKTQTRNVTQAISDQQKLINRIRVMKKKVEKGSLKCVNKIAPIMKSLSCKVISSSAHLDATYNKRNQLHCSGCGCVYSGNRDTAHQKEVVMRRSSPSNYNILDILDNEYNKHIYPLYQVTHAIQEQANKLWRSILDAKDFLDTLEIKNFSTIFEFATAASIVLPLKTTIFKSSPSILAGITSGNLYVGAMFLYALYYPAKAGFYSQAWNWISGFNPKNSLKRLVSKHEPDDEMLIENSCLHDVL